MKDFASYLRVILIVALVAITAEYFIDSGEKPAFLAYPAVSLFIAMVAIILIGIEVILGAMNSLADAMMTEEQKKAIEAQKATAKANAWYKKLYHKLLDQKPIEEEGEIILDHNYDGIKELDNSLPPWWLYGFYLTIIFAVVYMARYHIFDGETQLEEYQNEVAAAQVEIEEYKKTAKDLVDAETVVALTEPSDLAAGADIYKLNCIACHRADGGGGIGPNLTDDHWILGGGIKNIFHTVSEGGRSGKGMIAWKQSLKPLEIAQVSSYILTLYGTEPVDAKEPEGDVWLGDNALE